jgi:hypothetical protein
VFFENPEKREKFTQSKFVYIFLAQAFFCLLQGGDWGQNEEIYTDVKIFTPTWFAGLRVFPGLVFCLKI